MLVEKTLVDHFHLSIRGDKQLTDIINMAFPRQATTNPNSQRIKENRVFFTSRKTLVNEFNHFEGNMNIFQPAIDISKQALDKEVQAIKEKLQQL